MPETIGSALVGEKNTLHSTAPWIWLFEIQTDSSNAIRIAGYDEAVTFDSETYSPYPVQVGSQVRDKEGILQEIEVTASNAQAFLSAYLESGDILDKQCRLRLVNSDALTDVIADATFNIREATATIQGVSFRLAMYSIMESPLPAQLFNRTRCRWAAFYGGRGCNYNTSLPNAISGTNPDFDPTTCDFSLTGPNGCEVHGLNEAANGVPVLHPSLFGGFPDIPKGPARV